MAMTETQARENLRAAGLRTTSARLAVLSALSASSKPLAHSELVKALGPEADELAWSAIHGLATLAAEGYIERDELTLAARAEALCELILGGLEALEG